jgi:putative PIN family toxin of toxin-antitoxin system
MSYARERVVFDTSSLVPACLNPNREPANIFRRAVLAHDVFCSAVTFNELASVLTREKFNAWRPLEHRLVWLGLFRESVIFIEPTTPVKECRDPKDDQFLALAISAKAKVSPWRQINTLRISIIRRV